MAITLEDRELENFLTPSAASTVHIIEPPDQNTTVAASVRGGKGRNSALQPSKYVV